jgi:UDP-N-acetyl-2-amino-2-deoxyglucuronate dehydrogenase
MRFALRIGADAICEKPLVLNPWNLDALSELEQESGKKINTVLQLRVHPTLIELKKQLQQDTASRKHNVVLSYITSRGAWYLVSWKGQLERSGGLATNIGIHFFDLLIWLFGPVLHSEVHISDPQKTSGVLELERATVQWFLSIDRKNLPEEALKQNKPTFRSITIDDKEIEFSEGFANLHSKVYEETLAGRGFSIEDVRPSISLAHDIRVAAPTGVHQNSHPYLLRATS